MGQNQTKNIRSSKNLPRTNLFEESSRRVSLNSTLDLQSQQGRMKSLIIKRSQYFMEAKKLECTINDFMTTALTTDCGTNEETSLALNKTNELRIKQLEKLGSVVQNLKVKASLISNQESELGVESIRQKFIRERISCGTLQNQIETQYNFLLSSAKKRQKELNATSTFFVLLRETKERVAAIESNINIVKDEFQNISEATRAEFPDKYNKFQEINRDNEAHFYLAKETIAEMVKLGRENEILSIRNQIKLQSEEWSILFQKYEPIYEKIKFRRDLEDISSKIREKMHALKQIIRVGRDLPAIRVLQEKQRVFSEELDTMSKEIDLINERQNSLMLKNPDIVRETYVMFEEINKDWKRIVGGVNLWRWKLLRCYEIYSNIQFCQELVASSHGSLPSMEEAIHAPDDNNNNM